MKKYKYTKPQSLALFYKIVANNLKHDGYDKAQEIYTFWKAMYTGLDHDQMLEKHLVKNDLNKKAKKEEIKRVYNASSPKLVNKAIANNNSFFAARAAFLRSSAARSFTPAGSPSPHT